MYPLVSILIPAYDAEAWIAETLRSAIAQSWPRKEIIVIDDGSRDQTATVAGQFKSQGVRVVTQKNQGATAARNLAFSLSQGDYIQWLDADDLLAPDKISHQMEIAERCNNKKILLSSSWAPFMHRHNRAKFIPSPLWCDLTPVEWLLRKMQYNLHMQTATWLTSRELVAAAGSWDTRMLSDDDGEFFCRVIMNSEAIRFVNSAKVYYRIVGPIRLSHIGQSNAKLDALWASMQLHVGYLRSLEDSQRTRSACLAYLQNWLLEFYPERLDIVKQAETMAMELGGRLQMPVLPWKYAWIEKLFGWYVAKRAGLLSRRVRWAVMRSYDRALFRMESRKPQVFPDQSRDNSSRSTSSP